VTRVRVNYRARARVMALFTRRALEYLDGVVIPEDLCCRCCEAYEKEDFSACDYCGLPSILSSMDGDVSIARNILDVVARGGSWKD